MSRLLRSCMFTPADLKQSSLKKIIGGRSDCIVFDLEDAINPAKKQDARHSIIQFLSDQSNQEE